MHKLSQQFSLLTYTYIPTYLHTNMHTCFRSKRDKLSSSDKTRIRSWTSQARQQTECPHLNRLDYWASSQKLELDSAFLWCVSSPLDTTTGNDSPMVLAIYIFVVFIWSADRMPAHKLSELSRIKYRIWTNICKCIYMYTHMRIIRGIPDLWSWQRNIRNDNRFKRSLSCLMTAIASTTK